MSYFRFQNVRLWHVVFVCQKAHNTPGYLLCFTHWRTKNVFFLFRKGRIKSHGYYRCCGIQRPRFFFSLLSKSQGKVESCEEMGSDMLSTFSALLKKTVEAPFFDISSRVVPLRFFHLLDGFAFQPDHRAYDNSRFLFSFSSFCFYFYLRHLFLNFPNRSDKQVKWSSPLIGFRSLGSRKYLLLEQVSAYQLWLCVCFFPIKSYFFLPFDRERLKALLMDECLVLDKPVSYLLVDVLFILKTKKKSFMASQPFLMGLPMNLTGNSSVYRVEFDLKSLRSAAAAL